MPDVYRTKLAGFTCDDQQYDMDSMRDHTDDLRLRDLPVGYITEDYKLVSVNGGQ